MLVFAANTSMEARAVWHFAFHKSPALHPSRTFLHCTQLNDKSSTQTIICHRRILTLVKNVFESFSIACDAKTPSKTALITKKT